MDKAQLEKYRNAAEEGSIPDEENPIFLLSVTPVALLLQIVRREINVVELAKMQLENRGLDLNGNWVGSREKTRGKVLKKPRRKGPKL